MSVGVTSISHASRLCVYVGVPFCVSLSWPRTDGTDENHAPLRQSLILSSTIHGTPQNVWGRAKTQSSFWLCLAPLRALVVLTPSSSFPSPAPVPTLLRGWTTERQDHKVVPGNQLRPVFQLSLTANRACAFFIYLSHLYSSIYRYPVLRYTDTSVEAEMTFYRYLLIRDQVICLFFLAPAYYAYYPQY